MVPRYDDPYEQDKIENKIDKERRRNIEKDSDALKVLESVFDRKTRYDLVKMMNKGIIKDINFVIATGKEANVYHGYNKENEELAIKIYRTTTAEFKKNWKYVQGDPRFQHYKKGTYSFVYLWAKKEFKNLQRMKKVGVRVPESYYIRNNILVMEYIGKKQQAAPLLREVELDEEKIEKVYKKIIKYIKLMYKEGEIVHADLSEYNILYYEDEPIIIDVSQSVLIGHPFAHYFLYRDIRNINGHFGYLGANVVQNDELYEAIVGSKPDPKFQLYDKY